MILVTDDPPRTTRRGSDDVARHSDTDRVAPDDSKVGRSDHSATETMRAAMGVDIERVKALIATLEAVTSGPHFHRTAFRTPRKTFATLDEAGQDLNLMFDPEHRDFFCEQVPDAFSPVSGGWGRMGATRCDLSAVDEATLLSALTAAHRLAAPKGRT